MPTLAWSQFEITPCMNRNSLPNKWLIIKITYSSNFTVERITKMWKIINKIQMQQFLSTKRALIIYFKKYYPIFNLNQTFKWPPHLICDQTTFGGRRCAHTWSPVRPLCAICSFLFWHPCLKNNIINLKTRATTCNHQLVSCFTDYWNTISVCWCVSSSFVFHAIWYF